MTARLRRGARRLAVGVVLPLGFGAAISACGDSGTALAQQACSHIDHSIAYLDQADRQKIPADADRLRQEAYAQLRLALPIAAEAAFHDGQWQALMTTVAESNRVAEGTLVPALSAQCQQAESSVDGQPPPPSSIPPPAPLPTSASTATPASTAAPTSSTAP